MLDGIQECRDVIYLAVFISNIDIKSLTNKNVTYVNTEIIITLLRCYFLSSYDNLTVLKYICVVGRIWAQYLV